MDSFLTLSNPRGRRTPSTMKGVFKEVRKATNKKKETV